MYKKSLILCQSSQAIVKKLITAGGFLGYKTSLSEDEENF